MIHLLVVLTTLAGPAADFTESYLMLPEDEYHPHVADLNGDGRDDLLLSVLHDGRRRLHLHLQDAHAGFSQEVSWSMTLPPDAITFALLDVRADPGLEILLLTRSGVFSVSTAQASLRGNLRRELDLALFPDLAGASVLPRWDVGTDLDGDGRPELLVFHGEALVAFAPGAADDPGLRELTRVPCLPPEPESGSRTFRFGSGRGGRGPVLLPYFPGSPSSRSAFPDRNWLTHRNEWRLPAFVDWNQDGRDDAVFAREAGFVVRRQENGGDFAAATLHEVALPSSLEEPEEVTARLVDLDGDGREEVTIQRSDDDDHYFLVFGRDAKGAIEESPRARVKLGGLGVTYELEDLNGDGRQELIARRFDIPTGITQASRVRMDVTLQVYRGEEDAGLSRRPALRFERTLHPDDFQAGQDAALLDLSGDFDGDGLHDLMLLQPDGVLEITPLRADGDGWRLADQPFSRYRPPSEVTDAKVFNLSRDGVADLVLHHDAALTVFVSRGGDTP